VSGCCGVYAGLSVPASQRIPGAYVFIPRPSSEAAGQVAKTARVRRAKRLLDTTDMTMPQIALAAGFASLRRFNAVFSEVYARPPTELRRKL
jgi:AraC-like DNA-binding protein